MKILLVDDHSTVRLGIRLVLQAAEDLEVVGEAADGAAAVSMVRRSAQTWCSWTFVCR